MKQLNQFSQGFLKIIYPFFILLIVLSLCLSPKSTSAQFGMPMGFGGFFGAPGFGFGMPFGGGFGMGMGFGMGFDPGFMLGGFPGFPLAMDPMMSMGMPFTSFNPGLQNYSMAPMSTAGMMFPNMNPFLGTSGLNYNMPYTQPWQTYQPYNQFPAQSVDPRYANSLWPQNYNNGMFYNNNNYNNIIPYNNYDYYNNYDNDDDDDDDNTSSSRFKVGDKWQGTYKIIKSDSSTEREGNITIKITEVEDGTTTSSTYLKGKTTVTGWDIVNQNKEGRSIIAVNMANGKIDFISFAIKFYPELDNDETADTDDIIYDWGFSGGMTNSEFRSTLFQISAQDYYKSGLITLAIP